MKVAIHQPNYLPWCGYFAKLRACDTFVFLDDAEMSKGSRVPRTTIRTQHGESWLTVPVQGSGGEPIDSVRIAGGNWPKKHVRTLRQNYSKAPFFEEVIELLEGHYESPGEYLARFNEGLVCSIAQYLGLEVSFFRSSAIATGLTGDDRLIELVKRLGGQTYISGAGGMKYQDPAKFEAAGIGLDVRRYEPVPYTAEGFPFRPGLSIVDALFVKGPSSVDLLTYDSKIL